MKNENTINNASMYLKLVKNKQQCRNEGKYEPKFFWDDSGHSAGRD